MNQYGLLLKACRHALGKGVGILLALPALYVGILLLLSILLWVFGGELDLFFLELTAPVATWLYGHPFAFTVASALLAGAAIAYSGLLDALRALPVPVRYGQLAYLPLAVSLILWFVLLAVFLVLLPALGERPGHGSAWTSPAGEILRALPLGLLFITMLNRDKDPLTSTPLFIILIADTLMDGTWSIQADITTMAAFYPWALPFILAATAILLWETPGHRERWYCAAFTHVPMGGQSYAVREHAPPQRPHALDRLAQLISGTIKALALVAAIVLALRVLYFNFPNQTATYTQWFMALALGMVLLFGAFGLFWASIAALMSATGQRYGAESRPTRWLGRIHYLSMWLVMPTNAKNYKRLFLDENLPLWPTGNDSISPEEREKAIAELLAQSEELLDDATPSAQPRKRLFDWNFAGTVLFLIAPYSIFGLYGISVDYANEGSNIQGDAQRLAQKNYPTSGGFSQHHVALDLGRITAPAEREQAIAEIQAIMEENPNPASWLDGMKTTNGEPAQIPDRYRVEISQPEPHVVVIQSLGLHWDPTGHLAHALAKRILDALGNPDTIAIDPKFIYIRPLTQFERPRGFLDNTVHWIGPEEATGDNTGSTP